MKQAWRKWAGKINSLSLRERSIIFVMGAVIMMALFNNVLLDPLFAKEQVLSQQLLQMEGEIQSLREEMHAHLNVRNDDQNASMKSRLAVATQKLAQINLSLQEKQQQLIAPDEITELLESILIQNRKLQLITLKNLPTEPLIDAASTYADKKTDQTEITVQESNETAVQIFRHKVEIIVQGGYFDLLAYLDKLEKIPSRMFWDRISLSVDEYPSAILTLTVYTLSLDKAWLKV